MSDIIFIHIPKTGGTTINSAMQGTYWQTTPDFNYRHILLKKKRSNSGDIFQQEKRELFKNYKLFMMLRHPVDRMISEFHFLHDRAEFMNLLHPKPTTFEEYINHPQTPNYTLGFLIGDRIYDKKRPSKKDLKRVIDAIDDLPIHTGIFEYFSESMEYFSEVTGIEWSKKIEAKRVTFKRPKVNDLPKEIYDKIIENNALDLELYNYCLNKFENIKNKFSNSKIQFQIDKYNHVIPYAHSTCLFEYFMDNKHFIRQNFDFFKRLTFYLLKDKQVRDGRVFTIAWNEVFVETINRSFPNSSFSSVINKSYDKSIDPLDASGNIADALDAFFQENGSKAKKYYKPMLFDPSLVVIPEQKVKTSFFGRFFKK